MNHDDNSSHLRHVIVHQLQRILLLLHFGELLQLGVEKLGLGLQEVLQRVGLLLQSADLAFELRLGRKLLDVDQKKAILICFLIGETRYKLFT